MAKNSKIQKQVGESINSHATWVLLKWPVLFFLSLILIFIYSLKYSWAIFPSIDEDLAKKEQLNTEEAIALINQERSKRGLSELVVDQDLTQAAIAKSKDMFQQQYWSHFAPDGKDPWFFIGQAGYEYKYAGENLARDFTDEKLMFEAWMKSPTHQENILNPNYTETGMAVATGELKGFPSTLIVQFFAEPKAVTLNSLTNKITETLPKTAETDNKETLGQKKNVSYLDAIIASSDQSKIFFISVNLLIIVFLIIESLLNKKLLKSHVWPELILFSLSLFFSFVNYFFARQNFLNYLFFVFVLCYFSLRITVEIRNKRLSLNAILQYFNFAFLASLLLVLISL